MADDLVSGVISAVVGAASGGGVSLWLNRRSEKRSSYERSYASFYDAMEEIQTLASPYWRSGGRQPEVERKLVLLLESADRRLEALVRDGLPADKQGVARDGLDSLWDEVTGGSFETSARDADLARLQRAKNVIRGLLDLVHA